MRGKHVNEGGLRLRLNVILTKGSATNRLAVPRVFRGRGFTASVYLETKRGRLPDTGGTPRGVFTGIAAMREYR